MVSIRNTHGDPKNVDIGVPQGSILGPLLFIIYINDLSTVQTRGNYFIYADDTAIFFQHRDPDVLQSIVDAALPKITQWLQSNCLSLNVKKTIYQVYSRRKINLPIHVKIDNIDIEKKDTVKYLGLLIDNDMKFKSHIDSITNIVSRNVGMMCRARPFVENRQMLCLYNALILPYINYCCLIWGSGYAHNTKKLATIQKRAMRVVEGIHLPESSNPIFKKYNILKIQDIPKMQMMLVLHRHVCNDIPMIIKNLFTMHVENNYSTRQSKHFTEIFSTKNYKLSVITCRGPRLWNSIVCPMFNINEIPYCKEIMKKLIKHHLISQY